MRTKSKEVALLAISLLMLAGCNEKISAELQSGSTVTPPTVDPTTFSFKVTETSNVNLGYSLHQSGAGNKLKNCEVTRDNVAFTNDDYLGNPAAYDITCFLDVEELALYNSGMKLKVEATPNACEFVSYKPYSFFNRMPGDSTASFRLVTCATGVTNGMAAPFHGTWGPSSTAGTCGQYIDQSTDASMAQIVPTTSKRPITLTGTSEAELCRYDYSKTVADGENCDIGVIDVEEIQLTWDASASLLSSATSRRQITCGGQVNNCVKGPIKQESVISNFTRGTIYSEVPDGTAHSTERVFPGMITKQNTKNIEYVNYRRFLASTEINFWDETLSVIIPGAFLTNSTVDYVHQPELLEAYSNNAFYDYSAFLNDPTTLRTVVGSEVGYATKPLASDPMVGFYDTSSSDPSDWYDYRVQPFYVFSCLDNAHETTARIRIMVRDWDRIFDKNSDYMEALSDYDYGVNARQDRRTYVFDSSPFNNRDDWDDILPMSRKTGVFDPSTTWWAPQRQTFKRTTTKPILQPWNFPGAI